MGHCFWREIRVSSQDPNMIYMKQPDDCGTGVHEGVVLVVGGQDPVRSWRHHWEPEEGSIRRDQSKRNLHLQDLEARFWGLGSSRSVVLNSDFMWELYGSFDQSRPLPHLSLDSDMEVVDTFKNSPVILLCSQNSELAFLILPGRTW